MAHEDEMHFLRADARMPTHLKTYLCAPKSIGLIE